MERFSKRHGHTLVEKEITIREDAPTGLREFVIQTFFDLGISPKFLREQVCRVLRIAPDTLS